MTMPETTQSDLVEGCPTCGALPCDWAAGGADSTKTVAALLAERAKIESQMDGGRFDEWPTETFVGQLRMQARDNLDPEYSQFMAATATHMESLRAHCEAMEAALEPFASFAACHIDDEGWNGPMNVTRIVDWFGPSDFRAVLAACRKENPDV